jgi:hypothetical protein
MTCTDCLEAMLESDPAELRGVGRSDLAGHLRRCSSCRRVADAVLADTRLLARSIHVSARPARRATIAALAAAVILAVTMTPGSTRDSRPSDRVAVVPIASRTGIGHVADPGPRVASSPGKPEVARAGSRERVAPHGIHAVPLRAAAFVAVPIRVTSDTAAAADQPQVSVRPQGGRRAAVFRVAEANVTVVWLY